MSFFKDLISQLRKIDVESIALNSFREFEEEAIDLITESQLFERGEDKNGVSLGEYSQMSKDLRSEAGLPIDRITLKIDGNFHDGFMANASKFPILFDSSDSKRDEIVDQFSTNIFGLQQDNLNALIKDNILDEFSSRNKLAFQAIRASYKL